MFLKDIKLKGYISNSPNHDLAMNVSKGTKHYAFFGQMVPLGPWQLTIILKNIQSLQNKC